MITETNINAENECEMEQLLNNPCIAQNEIEKPLSPILNASMNRKFFGTKNKRKNRIKLSRIFETENRKEKHEDEPSKVFTESDFGLGLIEDEDLLGCLNRLEQIEKNREAAYKTLVTNRKKDLCFKKPNSPAPKTPKRLKTPTIVQEQIQNVTPANNEIRTICWSQQKPIILPTTSNFQTATGKDIQMRSETINKHSKLFEDILNCSQTESHRKNKYNFLKKVDMDATILNNNNTFISENNLSDTQIIFAAEEALNNLTDTSFIGFSKKDLYESEVIRNRFYSESFIEKNKIIVSKKREMQEMEFVPNKKLKTEFNSSYAGFSMSSGKKVNISSSSLSKSVELFKQIDSELENSKDSANCGKNVDSNQKKHSIKQKLNFFDDFINSSTLKPLSKIHFEQKFKIEGSGQFSKVSGKEITTNSNYLSKAQDMNVEFKNSRTQNSIKDKLKYFDQIIGDDEAFIPRSSFNVSHTTNKAAKNVEQKLDYFDNLLGKQEKPNMMPQMFDKFSSASGKSLQLSNSALKKGSSLFDDILNKGSNISDSFMTPLKSLNDTNSSIKKSKRKLGISCLKQIPMEPKKLQKARLIFDEDLAGISPIKQPVKEFNININACSTPISKKLPVFNSFTERKEKSIVAKLEDNFTYSDSVFTFDDSESKEVVDFEKEARRLEERLIIVKNRRDIMQRISKEKLDCDKKPIEGILYNAKRRTDRISLSTLYPGKQVDEDLFCITPQNAVNFHFKESSAAVSTEDGATVVPNIKDLIGVNEIEFAFNVMPGVDSRLIPKNWIRNHYKFIIWKLASYQRMFPGYIQETLTVEQVIQQLKYRYDREIDKAERSAVRKILEKDDVPQKRIILCVSDIKMQNELELTDGWYGIKTIIDERLSYEILTKKIQVGTKLIICGAELINCDGCHPLDVTNLTYLKINFNGTRRAKWDSRLGYQNYPAPFSVPIHTVHPNGGSIGRIDICIARSYPFRYLDKSQIKSVWRNKKAEERRAQNWENEKYKKLEENMRKEFTSKYNQKEALSEHEKNLFLEKRQELTTKLINETLAVMKLLVVDINGSPTKTFNLFLWKPTEDHVHLLKENTCMAVFNVFPKTNGDLHTCVKTVFESKSKTYNISDVFKRKLMSIQELNDLNFSNNFTEFDTVGVVVQVLVEDDGQEIWLADVSGRLLLIKIYEGPSTCLLLDNLKRGQVTSACNLEYKGLQDKFEISKAAANHFTVFSSYPKYKHLQNGLENLKKEISKDFDDVLRNCDNKIEQFKCNQNSNISYESDEDSTLISSRITSTDIALSLIDLDKFI